MVLDNKIDSFISELELGISFFQSAGDKLVRMLDEDPHTIDRIIEQNHKPWITRDVLLTIEAIGRKHIAPEAMLLPKHVLNRLAGLPVEEQLRILSGPVPVAVALTNGRHSTDLKPAHRLTRKEAQRVIGTAGVRTAEQQAALLTIPARKSLGVFEVTVMNGRAFVKQMPAGTKADCVIRLKTGKGLVEILTET